MSTTPTPAGLSAFEEHIKTTAWFKVLSAAKDDDDDGASVYRMARMAAQEAWTAALSSQPPSAKEGVRDERGAFTEWYDRRDGIRNAWTAWQARAALAGQAKSAAPVEPAAYRYKDVRGNWRYVGTPLTEGWALPANLSFEPLYATPAAAIPEAPTREEDEFVIHRMGQLLAEIAVIVNGPELPRRRNGYADLPEKVAALKSAASPVHVSEAPAQTEAEERRTCDHCCGSGKVKHDDFNPTQSNCPHCEGEGVK